MSRRGEERTDLRERAPAHTVLPERTEQERKENRRTEHAEDRKADTRRWRPTIPEQQLLSVLAMLGERYGVKVRGYLAQVGRTAIAFQSWDAVDQNAFFAANAGMVAQLEKQMDELRESVEEAIALCRADAKEDDENIPSGQMRVGEIRVSVPA